MENNSNQAHDYQFLPFTEEELKELNLTPEELDILDYASAYSQTAELLPDDFDTFENKLDETFNDLGTPDAVVEKLIDVCDKEPEFFAQMIALQEIMSAVKPYQEEDDSGTGK